MAYVEVRKDDKIVARRLVADEEARKGCRIRLGSAGKVRLKIGDTRKVGKYEVSVHEGAPSDDAHKVVEGLKHTDDSFPEMSATEEACVASAGARTSEGSMPNPVIEGYKIVGRLGEGGMGTVWRAVQSSTKREVALKFLGRHRFASDKARRRFEREVSLAAQLTHPNIARVYHSDVHRGVYYYAMELIDGVHLDKYVQQSYLTQQEILELFERICDAIQHAHEKGIVHRDLKPSNILVTEDGQPHIVDFGLAKATEKTEGDITLSIEGELAGTLAYMAPEQAAGRMEQISVRTDVYSLGVIMYRLLTGESPHDLTGSRYDTIKNIVEEDIASPRELNRAIDGDLEWVMLTALEKEPENRYPSAGVLRQDIKNYLNGEPLLARSMSTTYLIRKSVRKRAKPIAVFASLVFILAAIVAVAWCLVSSERKKRIEAERLAGLGGSYSVAEPETASDDPRHISASDSNSNSTPKAASQGAAIDPPSTVGEPQGLTELADTLPRGLVLYYSFDAQTTGTAVADLSGMGNHGIVEGAQWVSRGRIGGAYSFDAANRTDRIRVADHDTLDCSYVTVAAWINTTDNDEHWNRILDKDFRDGYNLCLGGDWNNLYHRGKAVFEVNSKMVVSKTTVADGNWHHVAGTFDGREVKLYVDGSLHDSKACQIPIPANSWDIGIGNEHPMYDLDELLAFDGLIDEVMLFNRALPQQEIASLYSRAGTGPGQAGTPEESSTSGDLSAQSRLAWFNEARFGMFIHWGLYSIPAGTWKEREYAISSEWLQDKAQIPPSEYEALAQQFNPRSFNASQWVRAAKSAGMKYITFVTKHADGYCLFDSSLTDFDSVDQAAQRDFVAELVEAARAEGIKIVLYYNMEDKHHPDYNSDLSRYVSEHLHGQIRELCTKYGPVDGFWFDHDFRYSSNTWRSRELTRSIRALQPNAIINCHLGKDLRNNTDLGDFFVYEQKVPSEPPTYDGEFKPWELAMTIGRSWGYKSNDQPLKSTTDLLQTLVDVVSKGGNLLLNVGPKPNGELPAEFASRLAGMGEWMQVNGESIYGTIRSPLGPLPFGRCTAKGDKIYIHIFNPSAPLVVAGLQDTVQSVQLLSNGTVLSFSQNGTDLTFDLPSQHIDPIDTVVVLDVGQAPAGAARSSIQSPEIADSGTAAVNAMVWISIDDPGIPGHEGFIGQMSKYETTNAQYCRFLNAALASGDVTASGGRVIGSNGSHSGSDYAGEAYYNCYGEGWDSDGATNGGAARIHYAGGTFTVDNGFENHPVTHVTWYGAKAFCNYYGYRLPTEREWRSVADYDGSYVYGCGMTMKNSKANYEGSAHPNGTVEVGSLGSYGYGLCDMAGNVVEWTDSTRPRDKRVIIGGGWPSTADSCGIWRSQNGALISYNAAPTRSSPTYGFRVCRSVRLGTAETPQADGAHGRIRKKILFFSQSMGYEHDVIKRPSNRELSYAEKVFERIVSEQGYDVVFSKNAADLSTESNFEPFNAIVFYTTKSPPINRTAMLNWLRAGGAFIGIHSACDSFYDWPDYGRILGGYFSGHGGHEQSVVMKIEDSQHPAVAMLGSSWQIADEIYQLRDFSRNAVSVVLSIDAANMSDRSLHHHNMQRGRDYPVAWTNTYGDGRIFYTGLGHLESVWDDTLFQQHLLGGIKWAMDDIGPSDSIPGGET